MKVTVIIPAYNAEATITETIRSVLEQTLQPSEVVVVNDGSQDSTQVEVQKFGDRVRLINQKNQGVSAARNHGIALSKTEWVSFLDSDDTWLPEKLAEQAKLLAANPELDWCSTRVLGLWKSKIFVFLFAGQTFARRQPTSNRRVGRDFNNRKHLGQHGCDKKGSR